MDETLQQLGETIAGALAGVVTGHQVEYGRRLLAHPQQCSQQRVSFQYAAVQGLACRF